MLQVDIDPREAQQTYYELLAQLDKRQRTNKLATYKPYPKQLQFHAAGTDHRERLLMAANQCLGPASVIQTGVGERRIVEMIGAGGFDVRSWADGAKCIAQASPVFLRGIEPAFRVHLDSGEEFDCSRKHQLLTRAGWLSLDLLMSRASGRRWIGTVQDWTANCGGGGRQGDRQLRSAQDSGSEQLPSQGDVLEHNPSPSIKDAAGRGLEHSRAYRPFSHPPIVGDHDWLAALCELSEDADGGWIAQRTRRKLEGVRLFHLESSRLPSVWQEFERLILAVVPNGGETASFGAEATPERYASTNQRVGLSLSGTISPRSILEFAEPRLRKLIVFPFAHPGLVGDRRIIAVESVGYKPILDIQVRNTNCYQTVGLVHHNCGKTFCGGAEMAIHLTGRYPTWWTGRRWDRPIRAWAGSNTSETTRDNPQRILAGEPKIKENWGTGAIPGAAIMRTTSRMGVADALDSIVVKHVSGGESTIGFKSYDQGRAKWQGETLDIVWFDEEPPQDIYTEGLTRTNATGGLVYLTFTPLLGMSEVVRSFLQDNPQ